MIINPKKNNNKSRNQRNKEWLEKVQARIEKRMEKKANQKRPRKPKQYTLDDLSPELREKLGLNNLNSSPDNVDSDSTIDSPF